MPRSQIPGAVSCRTLGRRAPAVARTPLHKPFAMAPETLWHLLTNFFLRWCQPDRGRLCRHAAVGLAARRPIRRALRTASSRPADRPRRRAGRHRRTRRPPHDQHRGHRRDLRHRRWPATRRRMSAGYRDEGDTQLAGSDRVRWASWASPARGSPRPRPPPLYAQNDHSEPSARSPSARDRRPDRRISHVKRHAVQITARDGEMVAPRRRLGAARRQRVRRGRRGQKPLICI